MSKYTTNMAFKNKRDSYMKQYRKTIEYKNYAKEYYLVRKLKSMSKQQVLDHIRKLKHTLALYRKCMENWYDNN